MLADGTVAVRLECVNLQVFRGNSIKVSLEALASQMRYSPQSLRLFLR